MMTIPKHNPLCTFATLCVALWLAVANTALGQDTAVVVQTPITTTARMVGIGAGNLLDTYLSPQEYSGTELRYIANTRRRRPERMWGSQHELQAIVAHAGTQARGATEIEGVLSYSYGLYRHFWLVPRRLWIHAGAQAEALGGFLYNTLGGNNPAQARLSINIGPTAAMGYNFHLLGRPMTASCELKADIAGLMFSPYYTQSYYEIFSLGNYHHNIIPTTPFSAPSLSHQIHLDIKLGRGQLRLGYLGQYRSAKVNQLKNHAYSHLLLIGYVKTFKTTLFTP